MNDSNKDPQLGDDVHGVQKVVFDYLEALLSDPDASIETQKEIQAIAEESVLEKAAEEVVVEEMEAVADEIDLELPETTVEQSVVEDNLAEPEPEPEPVVQAAHIPSKELNCVLIRMHGLNLAIPFDYIEGAVHLSSVSLTLDAAHDWCLGRFGGVQSDTNVIDTALWLIPERYKPEMAKYDELIILRGRHWALACDELVKSVRIPADKVSWAGNNNARPWLLGTYMEERCAILDIPELLKQFDTAF